MTKQQQPEFTPYRLPTFDETITSEGWIPKADLAAAIYPEQTCDTALPQAWVNFMENLGVYVRPGWVMMYDPNNQQAVMGIPMPIYSEALSEMECKEHNVTQWTASRAREILTQMREGALLAQMREGVS